MIKKHSDYDLKVRAVKAVLAGQSIDSVTKSFGLDRSTIHRWLQIYRKSRKLSSLEPKIRSGRPRITSDGQSKQLERDIKKPASKFGFETDFWTCRRIILALLLPPILRTRKTRSRPPPPFSNSGTIPPAPCYNHKTPGWMDNMGTHKKTSIHPLPHLSTR